MKLQFLRAVLISLSPLVLTFLGFVLFYFTDNPFHLLFKMSLILIVGGFLLTGLSVGYGFTKAKSKLVKITGIICFAGVFLTTTFLTILLLDYRFLFFRQLTAEQRRQDLNFLMETIRTTHPNPFSKISKEDFDREAAAVDSEISQLTDAEFVMRMTKLVATLKDGHSMMFPFQPASGFKMCPLEIAGFSDGIYVVNASPGYEALVGSRVVKIGKLEITEGYEKIKPFVAAENEISIDDRIMLYLVCAETLHTQGVTEKPDETEFVFENEAGNNRRMMLKPVSLITYAYWYFRPLERWKYQSQEEDKRPLYQRKKTSRFWMEYLEPSKTLYVRFNRIQNNANETITQFGRRIVETVEAKGAEKVVIDVRDNSGGDNTLYKQFVEDISQSPIINRRGHLFTIINKRTFSAAVNFVTMLEKKTNTIFVGEPTAAGPNHYGDAKGFRLPNSKIFFFVSTRAWQLSDAADARPAHEPQIFVPLTHQDFFSNRDPMMETIMNYR